MNYATVCSGIECPTVAWKNLKWKAKFFSEIKPFPCAVLKHHYPQIPNLGDMTKIHETKKYKEHQEKSNINLILGGTPCQSFSVAGLRKGMDDPRGNLALHFLKILADQRPKWMVWENVPGCLSSWTDETEGEGERWQSNDFDTFISGLEKVGYSVAWRILDAQYFGVPQQRRRVFVVGYLGTDWRPPFAVLFDTESLRGHHKKKREARQTNPAAFGYRVGNTSGNGKRHYEELSPTLTTADYHLVFPKVWTHDHGLNEIANTLTASGGKSGQNGSSPFVFYQNQRNEVIAKSIACTLKANEGAKCTNYLYRDKLVRKLTPLEYERLMGLPDNYTQIPWRNKPADQCPGSHRREACGNGIVVPVLKWIGERIDFIDKLIKKK